MNPDSVAFYYVYVLRSKKNKQVGSTNDLRKRFKQNNSGKSRYTKGRDPYELLYYEAYRNMGDTRSRERQLKSGQGKAYLRNRLKRFLSR